MEKSVRDGTAVHHKFPKSAQAFLSTCPSLVENVSLAACEIHLNNHVLTNPEEFRVCEDIQNDSARALIVGHEQHGWFNLDDKKDCHDAMKIMNMKPDEKSWRSASYGVTRCGYHPIYILALLGGDPRNPAFDDTGNVQLPDGNTKSVPVEGWPKLLTYVSVSSPSSDTDRACAWVFPIARRVDVEDPEQVDLRLTDEGRKYAELFFDRIGA